MPLRYYEGIEGSGKTSMMTRDLLLHHRSGLPVAAFPGYELIDDGKVVSQTLQPEDWVTLPDRIKKVKLAIAIDEVKNWFNSHVWYSKMVAVIAALMEMRRKFEVAILMTGPIFNRLPPELRELVHEIVHCEDIHNRNHSKPRGEFCVYYKEDRRGMFSERFPMVRFTSKKIFPMKRFRNNFDTYQAVDPMNQFIKVRFMSREVIVGPDGKVISSPNVNFNKSDLSTLEKYIDDYKTVTTDPFTAHIENVLKMIKAKGLKSFSSAMIFGMLGVETRSDIWKTGDILKNRFMCTYKKTAKEYILPEVLPTYQPITEGIKKL